MDPSPQAGSSSVTVEYTDPSGIFPTVQSILADKLPLKNLHWKSPTRPVRSIESLRIGFVPAQQSIERKPSVDTTGGAVPHRRHQIPGLRQTPYLKIYLLRCDDNDTYKATARKAVRDWIKSHATVSSSSATSTSQEKHDAFDWLILHVVQDGEGAEKAAPASKWGRTTTTVLEKVKADFNGASKSNIDRVAQLRLPRQGSNAKSPELADQIEDFIEKLKNAILASFDLRVAQYEEDIKEKDSQRSLPGWNFCTFFILKEGLARGFENVGLFEDALLGYDELAVGLDTTIQEQLEGTGDQHGSAFLTYSKDWRDKVAAALESDEEEVAPKDEDEDDAEPDPVPEIAMEDFPISSTKKPYREKILASDISIFDFRTYVFSRQLTLLLRAAKAPALLNKEAESGPKSSRKDKKAENLLLLSEICQRSTEFISLAARTLRIDLETGLADVDNVKKSQVVNNVVSSWAYAATCQVLSQTYTPALTLPESTLHAVNKAAEAAAHTEAPTELPRRSSSLANPAPRPPRLTNSEMLPPDALSSVHARPGFEGPKLTAKTGSEQLASGRGELFLMARRLLEEVSARLGWKETWNDLRLLFNEGSGDDDMADVSLDDEPPVEADKSQNTITLSGIELPGLKLALHSRKAFRVHYEELTDQMYRHHIAANRTYSTQAALADMALIRYRQSDYGAAASYFHHIAPFYGSKNWLVLEGIMLEMYTRCLKELNRSEEYVRVILRLLAKFSTYTQSNLSKRQKTLDASHIFAENALISEYVEELFKVSSPLQKEVTAPMTDFFADINVKPAILHYADKDGFQLQLYLRFTLGKRIDIDSIKLRLVGAHSSQSNEHWIEAPIAMTIKSSSTRVLVDSPVTLQGKYYVDRIEMRAKNIVFTFAGGKNASLPVGFREVIEAEEEDSRPYIYCYPPPVGLQAKIVSPHFVNLEELRTLELELSSGWNNIKTGTVRVRPATAGLRLRTAEAEVVEGDIKIEAHSDSGNIEFTQLKANSFVRFRIPYTVEEHHPMLSARAEVAYETDSGRFSYSSVHNIISGLPISVNVQDVFKDSVLFSRFTISPAMLIPLRILKCRIPESDVYEVQSSIGESTALNVFAKQPASLLYKIRQRPDSVATPGSRRSLRLSVDFTCVDDECLDAVESLFKSSIAASDFQKYTALLTSHLVETFRSQLSTSDMEVVGLVREVETLQYANAHWETLLGALKEPIDGLKSWLMEWHKNHPVICLPESPAVPSRHIIIPVDIPEIQVVHTAELRLANLADQPPHAAVGQMIAAELSIRHTRRWCSPEHRENGGSPLEFSYEIHANLESWLVGGRRRGNFTAEEGETKTFAIMLLPQKAGHLLLPGLEIRTFVPPSSSTSPSLSQPLTQSSTAAGGQVTSPNPGPPVAAGSTTAAAAAALQRRPIPCEVDYRNHGETVLVLPDLRTTTVSLSLSGGSHGGAWLIDSERLHVPST
ncbi:putative TMEM1 family protein [Aspergillus ibericus CBS 121593]|uniref:Putative transmembrane protein n=1 Tax=Aspergillus ibericus CBS 121593 TaxID=1448316 RepID=A0A395GVH2_9EURO|nr:putative transmembrane protein [Aspergillus ibericus CBS 121593]RAK98687.1 putative transmembrane protein [Aspergillus ibericus CBS 121593]